MLDCLPASRLNTTYYLLCNLYTIFLFGIYLLVIVFIVIIGYYFISYIFVFNLLFMYIDHDKEKKKTIDHRINDNYFTTDYL